MLINNQFKFFNKKGDNINSDVIPSLVVSVIDPKGEGRSAEVRAYTDYTGKIVHVQIANAGANYSNETYLEFTTKPTVEKVWKTEPADLTLGVGGELVSFTLPIDPASNSFWPFTSSYSYNNYYLSKVSAGLIESENFFIIEKVLDANGDIAYTYPRVDEYGPFPYTSYEANGKAATLTVESFTAVGTTVKPDKKNVIENISQTVINNITVGMTVSGNNLPTGVTVKAVYPSIGTVELKGASPISGTTLTFTFYTAHNLKVGSKISLHSGPFTGIQTVTDLSQYKISFNSTLTIAATSTSSTYGVVPQFEANFLTNSDEEWFLYEVEYGTNYPTIQKSTTLQFEFTNASLESTPDTFSTGNGEFIRQVHGLLEKKPFQLNVGLQADVEGVYVGQVEIKDITFVDPFVIKTNKTLVSITIEGEVESEDERLGLMLENFGRDITRDQELILRDSDINEDNPDFILLNQKRKEMLLQGDQIWPYVGSYKGLVNIINWFGYYDIRIKEYWLNVNVDDTYYGKYRQVPIAFQLKDKPTNGESLGLVPSKHYKKSNLFGLFYDIVRNNGDVDEFGVPVTEDAFIFTNEEALIKLFALKGYLKQKFLPLNTRIVDITGEGVYYERYAVNSWNDRNDRLIITAGKDLTFTYDKRSQITDLRQYDSEGGLLTPELNDILSPYANRYNFNDVIVLSGGGSFFGEIPQVFFPGSALQQARGECKVRGEATGSIAITGAITGINFQVGDIITLKGGVYDVPLRIEVAGVNLGGGVTDYIIQTGPTQGSNYRSLPTTFSQLTVLRPVGNQYEIPVGTVGFSIDAIQIPFEVEEVTLYDLGRSYSTYPSISFTFNTIGATAPNCTLNITQVSSSPVSYFNDTDFVKTYADAPNIPVGAIVNLATTFDVTWDELPYSWETFSGSNDATLKGWCNVLPNGTGDLVAVEIVSTGTDYSFSPTFRISGGGGYGAAVTGQIRNGKLNITEYNVLSLSSTITPGAFNDIITVTPNIVGGLNGISIGRIIKGPGIPDGTIIANIVGNDLYLTSYDGSVVSNNVIVIGDNLFIHQGVSVTAPGAGYTEVPNIAPNGGHTKTLYTWTEIGRGNFYQMEWKVFLTEPTDPTKVYNFKSGVSTIDDLINYAVILPFTGKYTVELDVYDTDNNKSNSIERNVIDVFMPEADFAYISKNVDECKDTWNEFAQIVPNIQTNQVAPSVQPNEPDPIEYSWDNAVGRWINITFNKTEWSDCDINWDTLSVTDLSDVNNPLFPICKDVEVLQISSQDVFEGAVLSYTDSTTIPSSVNPTIVVAGQMILPQLDPAYDPTDWIFIRRDDVVYQIEVLSADYSILGQTTIELATPAPLAFIASPSTWEVLREIEGTLVVAGDQIYNVDTNPTGFKIGEYVKLSKTDTTPVSKRNIISSKSTDSFDIKNGLNITNLQKPGSYGRVYKVRDYLYPNGNLNWSTDVSSAKTLINESGVGKSGVQTISASTQVAAHGQPILGSNFLNGGGVAMTSGTYTVTPISTTGSGVFGSVIVDITIAGGVPAGITIVNGGDEFAAGDQYTIAQSDIPGATSNLVYDVYSLVPVTYFNVPGVHLVGVGSTFNVTYDNLGARTVVVVNPGTGYAVGNTISITASNVGGIPATPIFFIVNSIVPVSFTSIPQDSTTGIGSGILLNINLDSNGNYTLPAQPIAYGGIGYAIGDSLKVLGSSLGGIDTTNDFSVDIDSVGLASSWIFLSTSTDPEIYDHTGRFLVNKDRATCNPLNEIRPGFTRMTLYAFNGAAGRGITEIDNISYAGSILNTPLLTNLPSTSSIDGVDATFNVDINAGIATVTINTIGRVYEVGETVTISGIDIGGGSPADDITFTVSGITPPSKDTIVYSQIFRTQHAYLDTSNIGTNYNVWNNDTYVIDVLGLNGGNLYDLNTTLAGFESQYGQNFSCYLEYEYDDFTTRERYYAANSPDETLYLDYNNFPSSDHFNNSITFGPSYDTDHTNWFYDYGIVGNDYSLKILNTGYWKGGVGTILTLDDSNLELYRTDTFFTACQQSFDEDYAETHLGTRVQTWGNYEEMIWSEFCGNSWDTLDFSDSSWCGYVIDTVDTNGGIKFNEKSTFNFQGIVGGMSDPEKFSQALYELNNSDNEGISKFNYSFYGGANNGLAYVDTDYSDDYAITLYAAGQIGKASLNTYIVPNAVIFENTAGINIGDVLYGSLVEPASVITSVVLGGSVDPSLTGKFVAYTSYDIPKKAKFMADATAGKFILKNVMGLHKGSLRVGETVTGDFLPSYISTGAKVIQLIERGGMVREIVFDIPLTGSIKHGNYSVEWVSAPNTTMTIPWIPSILTQADMQIFAAAKNPSVDNLGYLLGTNGVTFLPPQYPTSNINTTIAHTFPMNHFYSWFGFGENKVGAFEHGLQEFLTKYRYAQCYIDLGTAPFGDPGWYPANSLPPAYSYTNNPYFSNYLDAKAQSERLSFERSIGGAYTWEETRISKYGAKVPSGSVVMLSAEASDIVGKTKYFWRIKDGDTILAETLNNRIMWTFDYTGTFDVELTITDTNGNSKTETKKSFLNIYEATE